MTFVARYILPAFLFTTICPQPTGAYELRTHGEITRSAFESSPGVAAYLSALGTNATDTFDPRAATPFQRLANFVNTGTPQDWMIEGVIREDDFSSTPVLLGCPPPENPPTQANRVLNHFFDVQRGGRGLSVGSEIGIPAPDWALGVQGRGPGPMENQFSLPDARGYQYQSLTAASRETRDQNTARLFRALGHVVHLLEDMAQPQHTRNDPHAACADLLIPIVGGHSWYEHYTEDRTLKRGPRGGNPPPEIVLTGYEPVPLRPYRDFFTDGARRGMADFSSRNFVSVGTNLGGRPEPCDGLAEPPCDDMAYRKVISTFSSQTLKGPVSGVVTLYTRDVVDALTGDLIRDVPISSWSVWDDFLQTRHILPKFSLNRLNYVAMADILLPRAVGYVAGFLDAFFRGVSSASYEDHKYRISVSPEAMVGDFQLLYDDTDGTRRPLTSWSLRLQPDEISSPLAAPQLPPEAPSNTPCWLVFRGQLGLEAGAVVGAQVPCPTDSSPPSPQMGTWAEYSCIYGPYAPPGSPDIRYHYATANPQIDTDGAPVVRFFLHPMTGEATCTLMTWSLPSQPLNTVTSHPF